MCRCVRPLISSIVSGEIAFGRSIQITEYFAYGVRRSGNTQRQCHTFLEASDAALQLREFANMSPADIDEDQLSQMANLAGV